VVIPPLRDRLEDIPPLVRHFLEEIARQSGRAIDVSPATMSVLMAHRWSGNCRELRNALRSAAIHAGDGPILPGHLPRAILESRRSDGGLGFGPAALRTLEREHIVQTLGRVGGNRSQAARLLGIDRGTLARKLRGFGLDPPHKP
jgi:DNA-binding NtrC family response regulator